MKSIITIIAVLAISVNLNAQELAFHGDKKKDKKDKKHKHHDQPRPAANCGRTLSMYTFNNEFGDFARINERDRDRELRRYVQQNCLRAEQIKLLGMLYSNDRDKSEFFAYVYRERRIYDVDLFYQCASIFSTRAAQEAFYRFLHRENLPCGHEVYDDYEYWEHYNNRQDNGDNRGRGNRDNYDDRNPRGGYDDRDPRGGRGNGDGRGGNVTPPPPPPYLTDGEFQPILASVKSESFDNKRLDKVKFMLRGNAQMTCVQIAEIARVFSFDNNRLEFAKYAYTYAFDKQNYYLVADTMQFDNNKTALIKAVGNR